MADNFIIISFSGSLFITTDFHSRYLFMRFAYFYGKDFNG